MKKVMSSLNSVANSDGFDGGSTPDPNYSMTAVSWNDCGNCDDGTGDCLCPACCTGDEANCWCDAGSMNPNGIDPKSQFGQAADAASELFGKAQALVQTNKQVYDVTKAIAERIVELTKGWLGGTSQTSLDDGDFLWISKDKKTRKLPIAIHGKVSVAGWMAAWGVLHGSMGGADFGGGPSKAAVMAKLMARKPSGITIKDGKATRTSTQKAQIEKVEEERIELQIPIEIVKAGVNVTLGIIFGKAYIANIADRQEDMIELADLEKAAYGFLENENRRATNTHKEDIPGKWVASYVNEHGEWIVGFKPDDRNIAIEAANGDWVGFSIGGSATQVPLF